MRNRWFHSPELHTHTHGKEKKVTWLELFYDLIFVSAFIQLGNGLSDHVSVMGFVGFAAVFVPLWTTWTGFTYFINRFTIDDFAHRILVFIQMFAVAAIAVTAPEVFDDHPAAFSASCAVALGAVAIMYYRAWRQVPEGREYSKYWGRVFGIGAVVWLVSAFVPTPWNYVLWGLGLLAILAAPVSKRSRELIARFPLDQEHISERYGLLTIIVLGESFVKVLAAMPETVYSGHVLQLGALVYAVGTLLLTCCIWWIYFDDVAGSELKKQRFVHPFWLYAHLPLHIAITATGVAIKKAQVFELAEVAPAKYRWLLAGTLALVLFAVAAIDSVTERRQAELSDRARVGMRLGSAVFVLILAPAGGAMSAGLFLTLILSISVAQVIFDMMMAPWEAEQEHETHTTTGELARQHAAAPSEKTRPKIRRDIGEALHKGAPSELRRDLYFFFIEGSWTRMFMSLGFLYLVGNVFFAALYILEPGSISNVSGDAFLDAFFFSVQTMSTIGYGSMSPATAYGDIVVTVEAAVGLLGVALATGLMFAKASRAKAAVLFSKPMVLTRRHGVLSLMFRLGNARGNEIADANISVTVIRDDLSVEGHHIRVLKDLKLVRSRSPLFMLTWTVIHEIDDESPLAGVDWSSPEQHIMGLIVTMTGHDGTYAQTVHARTTYYPEDIRVGERFVDVIHELDDGRLLVDYTVFHNTEIDPATSSLGSPNADTLATGEA